jgi:MoxR-like ATPase
MSLGSQNEARQLLVKLEEQPNKFLFGVEKAVHNCILALITPMPRDGKRGKEYAQAHVYLLDKPGRGKTALFNYLSVAVGAKLGRVDGRPDMMPSDLTGYEDIDRHTGERTLLKGPIHIFFMDEINRTPSKGQAVLLGAMEGANVHMMVTNKELGRRESKQFPLYPISGDPNEKKMFFIVFATANTIEFEGTYPLSEAQQERFVYCFRMGLPRLKVEKKIRAKNLIGKQVEEVMDLNTLLNVHEMVEEVELSSQADEYIMRLIINSRPYSQDDEDYSGIHPKRHTNSDLVEFVDRYVVNGCSPRRNLHMEAATKACAFLRGENKTATVDDVKTIAHLTMKHVIMLHTRAFGDNVTADQVVERIVSETEAP